MTFSGDIVDRISVYEFYGKFSYLSSSQEREAWLNCWADECTWNTTHFKLNGKAQVAATWDSLWQNFEKAALTCTVGSVEVEGNSAKTAVIASEVIRMKSGGVARLIGIYHDILIRSQGNWRFKSRQYSVLVDEPPEN